MWIKKAMKNVKSLNAWPSLLNFFLIKETFIPNVTLSKGHCIIKWFVIQYWLKTFKKVWVYKQCKKLVGGIIKAFNSIHWFPFGQNHASTCLKLQNKKLFVHYADVISINRFCFLMEVMGRNHVEERNLSFAATTCVNATMRWTLGQEHYCEHIALLFNVIVWHCYNEWYTREQGRECLQLWEERRFLPDEEFRVSASFGNAQMR